MEGTGNYAKGGISTVVRYAKSVTLRISLDPNNNEMIYTPLLVITYLERLKSGVPGNSLTTVSFTAEYEMVTSNFLTVVRGLFIGAMILFGLLVFGQICVWCQLPQLSDVSTTLSEYMGRT